MCKSMIEYQHVGDKSSVCYALGHPTRPNIKFILL